MDASNTYLSLIDASNTYLERTGTPTSIATNTTFTGTINGAIISTGASGDNTSVGTTYTTQVRSVNVGIRTSTLGNDGVSIGYMTTCEGANTAVVGSYASTGSSANHATAIGSFASAAYNYSTALGSGATTAANHQIVIGTSGETIYCPGTTSNGSLIATNDVYVNGTQTTGIRAGVGNYKSIYDGSYNTCFGRNTLGATTTATNSSAFGNGALANLTSGADNTAVGHTALQQVTTGIRNTGIGSQSLFLLTSGNFNTGCGDGSGQNLITGSYNTFFGYVAGNNIDGSNNTFIGAGAGRTGGGMPYNSTGLGCGVGCNFSYSTVIGAGATSTADHQIVIGTSGEIIYCPGTSTTTGSLQLAGGLFLQSTYLAVPSSNMLGYSFSSLGGSATSIASAVVKNLSGGSGISVPTGVWSISWTSKITCSAGSITSMNIFVGTTAGGGAAISPCSGQYTSYATETQPDGSYNFKSGHFTYQNTSASPVSLYVNVDMVFATGTFTGFADALLTRIA